MGIIVAIGGDQNQRNGHGYETEFIDRKIVDLANKNNPNFLFVSVSGLENENEAYEILKQMYIKLGCICDFLNSNDLNNDNVLEKNFKNADIIYFSGGNTLTLIDNIQKNNLAKFIEEAYVKNCVLCGSSAGAMIYFSKGHSDCYKKESGKYALIDCLGYINAVFCPHYTIENRKESLRRYLKDLNLVGLALDNNAALIINENNCELISCNKKSNGYRCYYSNGEYYKETIVKNYIYQIDQITSKKMLNY